MSGRLRMCSGGFHSVPFGGARTSGGSREKGLEVRLDGVRLRLGIGMAWLGCNNVFECVVRRMSRCGDALGRGVSVIVARYKGKCYGGTFTITVDSVTSYYKFSYMLIHVL